MPVAVAPVAPPPVAPVDFVPIALQPVVDTASYAPRLSEMLSARRSQQLDVAAIMAEAETPGVYEITLDEEEVAVELPRAEISLADETDFSGLTDDNERNAPPQSTTRARASLPKIPLFSSLAEADLRELIERMALADVVAGQPIVREGDRGGSLYVLASGEARVTVGGVEVARLSPPARFFGEVGLFTDDPRTATLSRLPPIARCSEPVASSRGSLRATFT